MKKTNYYICLYSLIFPFIRTYSLIVTYVHLYSLLSKKNSKEVKKNYFSEVLVLYHPVQTQEKREKSPNTTPNERKRMSKTTLYKCKRNEQDHPIRTQEKKNKWTTHINTNYTNTER